MGDENLTPSISTADWDVVVTSKDKKCKKLYSLPNSSSLGNVKQLWAADHNLDVGALVLFSVIDVRLSDELTLADVGETYLYSQLVKLTIECGVSLRVRLHKESHITLVPVFLSDLSEQLLSDVRCCLRIPEARPMRVRSEASLVAYGQPLDVQGVAVHSELVVELAFEVIVTELWSQEKEKHLLFASESCEVLLGDDRSLPCRLTLDGRDVDPSDDLMAALTPASALSRFEVEMELHVQREVTLMSGQRLRERAVWPTNATARLTDRPLFPLHHDGRPVEPHFSFSEAEISEHAVLTSDTQPAWVVLTSGVCRRLDLPPLANVADLHLAVSMLERSHKFVLRHGNHRLEPSVKLSEVRCSVSAPLQVEVRPRPLTMLCVEWQGKTLWWSVERDSLRFSDVVDGIVQRTSAGVDELMEMEMRCVGCSRILTKDEELFQSVPIDCCRVRSLRLSVREKERRRDVKLQSRPRTLSLSVQHPPPKKCPLYISAADEEDFVLTPELSVPVTVGKIREVVAAEMQVDASHLRLDRVKAFSCNGPCFAVCEDDGDYLIDLPDMATKEKVIDECFHKQPFGEFCDHLEFPFYEDRANGIIASKMDSSSSHCTFFVFMPNSYPFTIEARLPRPHTVGDVRQLVASHIRLPAQHVKLKRFIASAPSGKTFVPVDRSCDSESEDDEDSDSDDSSDSSDSSETDGMSEGDSDLNSIDDTTDEEGYLVPNSWKCYNHKFLDVDGSECKVKYNSKWKRCMKYSNDKAEFKVAPGERNMLLAFPRRPMKAAANKFFFLRMDNGENISCELGLPPDVSVGDIRFAIAAELGVKPSVVVLKRLFGSCESEEYGRCYNINNIYFGDDDKIRFLADAEIHEHDVADHALLELRNNDDPFSLVHSEIIYVLYISQVVNPRRKYSLYLRLKDRDDVLISVYLPKEATVGQIRTTIAEFLKAEPKQIEMKRWIAETPGYFSSSLNIHVCDRQGHFVSGRSQSSSFCEMLYGRRRMKKDTFCCKLVELNDDDEKFISLPKARNIIYVNVITRKR